MTRALCAAVLVCLGCGPGLRSNLCGAVGEPCCEAAECEAGARCGADQRCQPCGGVGQPCCQVGAACAGQALCSSDVCLPCGARGQACCAGDACGGALACSGGACTDATSCTSPCDVGASRCAGGGIETCVAIGACPAWRSTLAQCPSGSSCQAPRVDVAECVEACPGACVPESVLCTSEGLKRCVVSGACPSLVAEPDDGELPTCVTGATVSADLAWESPTPLHTPLVAIVGDRVDKHWVLDVLGNVIHNGLGVWEYEVRPAPGKRALSLTSCGLVSRVVAAGEGGTIYRRGSAGWTTENVGSTTVSLRAVACDFSRTFAAGSDGRLYVRGSSGWASHATGALGPINGMGYLASQQRVLLVGNRGEIINCDVSGTPVCASEASGTQADLLAAWADPFTNTAYAVGEGGTFLGRFGSWGPVLNEEAKVTDTLRAVHGWYDPTDGINLVAAVGDRGAYVARPTITTYYANVVAGESLTGVMMIDADHVFVSSAAGRIHFANQVSPPPTVPFAVRGGAKPTANTLRGVASLGAGRLIAVGDEGTRLRRENGAWIPDGVGATTSEPLHAVATRGNAESYAVGGAGTILVRRYGTWSNDSGDVTTKALFGVVVDATRAWAVGADGTWLEKDLAGGAWGRLANAGTTNELRAIAARLDGQGRATELVAVGAGCTLVSRVGATVTTVPLPTCPSGTTLRAAVFTPTGELFVGGDEGVLLRRTTSGFQREYLGSGTLEDVNALVVQGSSVWALCSAGELYRRVSSSWSRSAEDVTTDSLLAGVGDPQDGLFVLGGRGLIWRRP